MSRNVRQFRSLLQNIKLTSSQSQHRRSISKSCIICPLVKSGPFNSTTVTGFLVGPSLNLAAPWPGQGQTVRQFFGWLNAIFNRYDGNRVLEVGPDRACAEWLIRCGAGVKWNRGSPEWFRDYNALPATYSRSVKIIAIDGTDSAVMSIGFKHLEGLTECRSIVFHKSSYLDDEALHQLVYVNNCLKELQISSCGNITGEGLASLTKLSNLEKLTLYDLPEIKNREEWIQKLSTALPKCKVEFHYAQASEREKQKALEKND